MDVPTLLRRVKRQFGDEYDTVITNDDIYGWIYEAELDIIRNAPDCNIISQNVAINVFPSNVPTSVTIQRVAYNGKALAVISKEELDLAGISDATTNSDIPAYWYMNNKQVVLFPASTSTQQVTITYSKTPTIMVDPAAGNSFTVPEVFHTDIIAFCLSRAHNKNQNAAAEKTQMDLYDRALPLRREEANVTDQPLYKGDDPMDYNFSDYI